jgi:voltage-gated potassium channel Kch
MIIRKVRVLVHINWIIVEFLCHCGTLIVGLSVVGVVVDLLFVLHVVLFVVIFFNQGKILCTPCNLGTPCILIHRIDYVLLLLISTMKEK